MFKKFTAITLSLLMVLSSVGAFAATTTKATGMVVYTDNLNQHTENASYSVSVGFPHGTTTGSDVFSSANAAAYSTAKILTGAGADGGTVLSIETRASSCTSQRAEGPADATEAREYSFDIRFVDLPDDTSVDVQIGRYKEISSGRALFRLAYATEKWMLKRSKATGSSDSWVDVAEVDTNAWYKIVIRAFNKKKIGYLLDANGNILATTAEREMYSATDDMLFIRTDKTAGCTMYLDNAEMKVYKPTTVAPELTVTPVLSGNNVSVDTKSVTIVSDQPLDTENSVATLDGNALEIKEVADKLYTYTVEFNLEGNKAYTLDLSGLTNGSKAVGANYIYSFSTPAAYVAPEFVESVPADGATNVAIDTNTMSITFNKEMQAPSSLTLTNDGGDINADVATADNKTFTLTWNDSLKSNATYKISLLGFADIERGTVPSTETISFTAENLDIIKLTDSFEDASKITDSGKAYSSDVISMAKGDTDNSVQLVNGYNGNALQFITGTDSSKTYLKELKTKSQHYTDENNVLVATWRFKLDKMADCYGVNGCDNELAKGSRIFIGAHSSSISEARATTGITTIDGKPHVYISAEVKSNAREIKENRWYNVTMVIKGTNRSVYFVDTVTGEFVYSRSRNQTADNKTDLYISPALATVSTTKTDGVVSGVYNLNQKFTVDDFSVWQIKPARDNHKLALAENGVTKNVNGTDADITFNFNQPVMLNDTMIGLYKGVPAGTAGALTNEYGYAIPEITYPDFCKAQVSFSELDNTSSYTLDYSGANALSGADLGADKATAIYGFETEAAPEEVSVVGDITFAESGLTAGSHITADIYSKASRNAKIIAAFYERNYPAKLSAIEMQDISLSEGLNRDKEITLDKNIEADYVMLYVWDGTEKLVPLMDEYKSITPADSLSVLMIGNSLSEDAQRYLNKLAEAGGLDLDLTVKGVGGSRLSHHKDNLEAEIAFGLHNSENYKDDAKIEAYQAERASVEGAERYSYFTYKNGVSTTASSKPVLVEALMEKNYDIISLQQFSSGYSDEGFDGTLEYLAETIRQFQPTAEIMLYQTWSNYSSTQETRFSNYTQNIKAACEKWAAIVGKEGANVTVGGDALTIIPAGKAFYFADYYTDWAGDNYNVANGDTNPEEQANFADKSNAANGLWRDVNHASYYGVYLADAVWYETITGKKAPVTFANGDPIVPVPTGEGPGVKEDEQGNEALDWENMTQYFEAISEEEHIERLELLSDIAHNVVVRNRH